jgi:hypothetical protein
MLVVRKGLLTSSEFWAGRSQWPRGLRPSASWDRGFESHRGHGCLSCTVFVLWGIGLYDGPIPRPEELYRQWCVSECDQVKNKNLNTYCEEVVEVRTTKKRVLGRAWLTVWQFHPPVYVVQDPYHLQKRGSARILCGWCCMLFTVICSDTYGL